MDFLERSYQKELLDRDDIPFADIRRNMQELDFINTWLGGHRITITGLKKLITPESFKAFHGAFTICEIGCGDGNNMKVVKKYCESRKIPVRLIGVDINPHCIEFARSKPENAGMEFISSDYKIAALPVTPDIVFSSLFCHHFTDDEMLDILYWMNSKSRLGFFINDLHRHALAYYSIKYLTGAFSKSYLVKNDAPLSVLRGFNRAEVESLLNKAGIHSYSLQWKWAFRWLLTVNHLQH